MTGQFINLIIKSCFLMRLSGGSEVVDKAQKALDDKWMYYFDLAPYLPYLMAIAALWSLGALVFSIMYSNYSFRSFAVVITAAAGIGAYFYYPVVGPAVTALILVWLVSEFIVHLARKLMKKTEAGYENSLFYFEAAAVVMIIPAVLIPLHIYSQPENLIRDLGVRSPVIEKKLFEMGRKAVPVLEKGLSSKDPRVSAASARLLRKIDGPFNEDEMIKVIRRGDKGSKGETPRNEAVLALTEKGTEKSIVPLLQVTYRNLRYVFAEGKDKLLFNRKFYNMTIDAIKAIEERSGKSEAADLTYEYSQKETDAFNASTWGLIGVELGGEQSIDSLSKIFNQIYKNGQLMILDSLEYNREPATKNLLFAALQNPSVKVRRRAIEILKKREELIAQLKMIEMLEDKDADVRRDAAKAIRAMTGENLGYNPDAPKSERTEKAALWKEWWIKKARE